MYEHIQVGESVDVSGRMAAMCSSTGEPTLIFPRDTFVGLFIFSPTLIKDGREAKSSGFN